MSKKIKITEEQYNMALKEGVTLTADLDAAGGDANKAIETTKQEAQKNGIDINKANIQIPANEGKIITKKRLMNNRERLIKENSDLFSLDDFIKKLKK